MALPVSYERIDGLSVKRFLRNSQFRKLVEFLLRRGYRGTHLFFVCLDTNCYSSRTVCRCSRSFSFYSDCKTLIRSSGRCQKVWGVDVFRRLFEPASGTRTLDSRRNLTPVEVPPLVWGTTKRNETNIL